MQISPTKYENVLLLQKIIISCYKIFLLSKIMASTKTRAVLLVIVALYAYSISETDVHLTIGRREFRPVRQELKELLQH